MPTPVTLDDGRYHLERIMLFGDADAGKTYQFLKIAEWHQKRGSDAHFYGICSPGNEWDVMCMPGAEFEHLKNVTFDVAFEMQDWFDLYKKYWPNARKGVDWLCCDVAGDVWQDVQAEYAQIEWGGDLGSKWITEGGLHPIAKDGMMNKDYPWGRINSRYRDFANNKLMRWPGHLVGLYWETPIPDGLKKKDKEAADLFTPFDIFPQGNKKDYKRFHSIIHLAKNSKGEHVWRSVRDRQRKLIGERRTRGTVTTVSTVKAGDLFRDYLVKIGGWKP